MKCEKWSCRSVRHDRTPARPVTVTKMQRSRPAGKPDFSAMGCPCVWRNLSEQRCSARCVSGMFRKVDGGRCRCWRRRVANRFAGSSFGDVSRSGAERDDREIQKALFVPCSCPGGTTQKIPSYYFLSKNSLIWSFGTISDLKA